MAYNAGWIIFKFPSYKKESSQTIQNMKTEKKSVKLFFWHKKRWKIETVEILQTENQARNIQHIINSWLTLLDEDNYMKKKATLQSALVSGNNELFLSFDRNPFNESDTTYEKWMWVEALLKTLRENNISIQNVRLLEHHQPMEDYHLDFSNSWPLIGFQN